MEVTNYDDTDTGLGGRRMMISLMFPLLNNSKILLLLLVILMGGCLYFFSFLVFVSVFVFVFFSTDYLCRILFAVLFGDNVLRGDNNAQAPGGMGSLTISYCKYDKLSSLGFNTFRISYFRFGRCRVDKHLLAIKYS